MSIVSNLSRYGGSVLARLPLSILYGISSALASPVGILRRYRRKVVYTNLRNSFPEKSEREISRIAKGFYRQFADTLVESFKLAAFPKRLLPSRVHFTNPELLEKYYREGRKVVAVSGHYCNWEWLGISLPLHTSYPVLAVYKPLSNRVFDSLVQKTRSIHGTRLVPMKQAMRTILSWEGPVLSYLIADQAPNPDNAHWTTFLNQDTPVFTGPEKIAKASNAVVVFLNMQQSRRGFYEVTVQELCTNPEIEVPGAITEKHVRALENQIKANPAPWLWSHKRWKHSRKQ